jgi:hypothetical protein
LLSSSASYPPRGRRPFGEREGQCIASIVSIN